MSTVMIDTDRIAAVLKENLSRFKPDIQVEEVGYTIESGEGIVRLTGLSGVMSEEMLLFENSVYGMAMNLEKDEVGAIVLGDYARVQQGTRVKRTGKVLQVPDSRYPTTGDKRLADSIANQEACEIQRDDQTLVYALHVLFLSKTSRRTGCAIRSVQV